MSERPPTGNAAYRLKDAVLRLFLVIRERVPLGGVLAAIEARRESLWRAFDAATDQRERDRCLLGIIIFDMPPGRLRDELIRRLMPEMTSAEIRWYMVREAKAESMSWPEAYKAASERLAGKRRLRGGWSAMKQSYQGVQRALRRKGASEGSR